MAEINVQRRSNRAWMWVLAIIGVIALLWAVVQRVDLAPEAIPTAPGARSLGEPRDFAMADGMSSQPGRDTRNPAV